MHHQPFRCGELFPSLLGDVTLLLSLLEHSRLAFLLQQQMKGER
jgi:hypothetical protein